MSLELRLEQRYPSRPETVFDAWADIDKVRRWFGCGPGRLWTVHVWDCRVGGGLQVSMEIEGQSIEVDGEFLAVEPARRLEYRWGSDEVVRVEFHAEDGGTLVRLFHRGLKDDDDRAVRDGGWTFCLSSLGRFVAG